MGRHAEIEPREGLAPMAWRGEWMALASAEAPWEKA